MTINRLPGVYFTETVNTITVETERIPLFVVQTSTAIDIDNKLTYYENFETFKTAVEGKGLTNTVAFMEQAFTSRGYTNFYVYSVKQDTSAAFTSVLTDCGSHTEIRDVFYFEETKSGTSNTILQKVTALVAGVNANYEVGAFRQLFIIPFGTIEDAVENAENVAPETTVYNWFTSTTFPQSGRLTFIVPDMAYAGAIGGEIIHREYNDEIGYTQLNASISTLTYNFTDTQLLGLANAGVLTIREERVAGAIGYRIVAGVNTGFSANTADGLIISRTIADELLGDVRDAGQQYIKVKESENARLFLQSNIDAIIATYVGEGDVIEAGTSLVVSPDASNPYVLNVTGNIQTVGSILAIEVNSTITI